MLPLPGPDPMHGPRNLHPYLRSNDATAYFYSVPIIPLYASGATSSR
jgi:hypothetical protein